MTRLRALALALTTGALLSTTACGGGVVDAVDRAAVQAEPTVPIEDMTTEELLESDLGESAYDEDGVLHFPAAYEVPDLTMPDGAAITNVSYDIFPGFYVQEVDADEVYDAVEAQLTDAGFTVDRTDINGTLFLSGERPGSGPVTRHHTGRRHHLDQRLRPAVARGGVRLAGHVGRSVDHPAGRLATAQPGARARAAC